MQSVKGTRKWCFVPRCSSSSAKTPEKRFVIVPVDLMIRRKWASAAKREDARTLTSRRTWFCCEDHFEVRTAMTGRRLHSRGQGPTGADAYIYKPAISFHKRRPSCPRGHPPRLPLDLLLYGPLDSSHICH